MKKSLEGIRVLVTAGPTREFFDPVRFLSNPSSGKMGYAVAKAALDKGARVTLISGPCSLKAPKKARLIPIVSADDLHKVTLKESRRANLIFMIAAVSDYRPAKISRHKIKKKGRALSIRLVPTRDILKELGSQKKPVQCLIGFAAETHRLEQHAYGNLKQKKLDFIVANKVGAGLGFESQQNKLLILSKEGQKWSLPTLTKEKTALRLIEIVLVNSQARFNC